MSLYFMLFDYNLIIEYFLFSINFNEIYMTLLLDWMSLLFMSFVMFISSMVIKYSESYMEGDYNLTRFIMLIMMFVVSMILLIISPNLISILLGWDGLGLVSYCLVIYYQNIKSFNAGMLTALSNRIGDVALLMAIAWMLNYGSWNYYFYTKIMFNDYYMMIISFLVMLAAMTKSAQIPFSSWLPAAMAAPTPVSSLVHSSTLVTAGVYLMIRFNGSLSTNLMLFLMMISSLTMFMAGLGANFEFDLKKIIALSTLSQLGLMMSIYSVGEFKLAFFHLLSHALFKALLFMCAGSIIHNLNNTQDIRFMGGLINYMPLTSSFFIISNMSLCGFPFLAGFYSKDLILEVSSMSYISLYIYIIFFLSTGLTSMYTLRLIYYSILGDNNFMSLCNIVDYSEKILESMMMLNIMVIFGGSMLNWLMFNIPYLICLPFMMKFMALLVTLIGAWMGLLMSQFSINYNVKSMNLYNLSMFLSLMWNMPYISTLGVNYYFLYLGKLYYKNIDQGWSEYFGSQKLYMNMKNMSQFMQFIFNNNFKIFMLLMVIWIIFLMLI
uniref:NADH-ubiquinone oxidoreductase chain 5 n=1 Tax=Anobiinae sp. BMNH 1274383 TaxID=1796498 RepID=A0A140EFU6_9COLE|nr:NADH dehydrogenase subunit 5 [Anobiinae sp. BMNH 1274383]